MNNKLDYWMLNTIHFSLQKEYERHLDTSGTRTVLQYLATNQGIQKAKAHEEELQGNKSTLLGQIWQTMKRIEEIREQITQVALPEQAGREYEIWMEGYSATGESAGAQMIGKAIGSSFDEAVTNYMNKTAKHGIEVNGRERYRTDEDYKNRRSNWNIWACSLFDNEADARKSFG